RAASARRPSGAGRRCRAPAGTRATGRASARRARTCRARRQTRRCRPRWQTTDGFCRGFSDRLLLTCSLPAGHSAPGNVNYGTSGAVGKCPTSAGCALFPLRPIRDAKPMAETQAPSSLGSCPPSAPTVLVVDDEQATTTFLTHLLGGEGYIVKIAHDGPSALEHIAIDPPDIVILKVLIPGLDGFDVCRKLKREPATRLTPILLMTPLSAKEHRIEGLEAGADEVFASPIDTAELLTRVRVLTRVKRYTDDLDAAASIVMTLALIIESRDGH